MLCFDLKFSLWKPCCSVGASVVWSRLRASLTWAMSLLNQHQQLGLPVCQHWGHVVDLSRQKHKWTEPHRVTNKSQTSFKLLKLGVGLAPEDQEKKCLEDWQNPAKLAACHSHAALRKSCARRSGGHLQRSAERNHRHRVWEDKACHSLLYYCYTNYSGIFVPFLFKRHGKMRKKMWYSIPPPPHVSLPCSIRFEKIVKGSLLGV